MCNLPTCYFWILAPLDFPVRAAVGEYLAILGGAENLWVIDETQGAVVRRGSFPEAKLWSALDDLEARGIIRLLSFDDASRMRPPAAGHEQSRPMLRLIRVG